MQSPAVSFPVQDAEEGHHATEQVATSKVLVKAVIQMLMRKAQHVLSGPHAAANALRLYSHVCVLRGTTTRLTVGNVVSIDGQGG
jgi:hypothetical protein